MTAVGSTVVLFRKAGVAWRAVKAAQLSQPLQCGGGSTVVDGGVLVEMCQGGARARHVTLSPGRRNDEAPRPWLPLIARLIMNHAPSAPHDPSVRWVEQPTQ